jgi:glutaredoxin-like protein NrdH
MTSSTPDYTVYTKPGCPNCDKTKAYFDRKGITYQPVDITEIPAADKLTQAALRHKAA